MRAIGQIQQLQVQLGKLKKGKKPDQHYDPSALRVVPALRLTRGGVIGLVEGQELLDVHHADHPRSRNRKGNSISFNFSSHYAHMRHHFGDHLILGCAGENILIASDEFLDAETVSRGLIIKANDGSQAQPQSQGFLAQIKVAHPCLSFSTYALNVDRSPAEAQIKETLQFLDGGTRGFYCEWEGEPVIIQPGDKVYLPRTN